MKLEIDIPEHQYNNIMAIDSMSLGRAPYKGIIMYAINAIKHGRVLKQELTTKNDLGVDCISRADALDCVNWGYNFSDIYKKINELPSITPQEPKTGHWIDKQHLLSMCSAECSECKKRASGYIVDNGFSLEYKFYDYCPNCGADMREVKE